MATQGPAGRPAPSKQAKDPPPRPDPDMVWHTRGPRHEVRQDASRARPGRRELPPSRVPRLLLWALFLAVLAGLANAVLRMTA
ncbi:hypothetical protein BKK79_12925 [Cupriavidus sp. USMAA2-4]|uniref:DUF2970 domain-containing protein n=1 Tax=Cupriavidus malaysiensis TaxID=367825 RepID=A0ABM6F7W1_9BURK|nr:MULTISPECIES: hypothetical protein [Cupriavidus]AOY92580.1 hypothetical protein BKK79_12925 [Cupriavidus sp. USMAA2-4]AOZ00975.1 hypothetical protein BKK81_18265 [Cupriavidus sp. USMAHM13]AOZ07706.1 hypothetical protein BKK80_19120 [Cupriavidus malaysiensis]